VDLPIHDEQSARRSRWIGKSSGRINQSRFNKALQLNYVLIYQSQDKPKNIANIEVNFYE